MVNPASKSPLRVAHISDVHVLELAGTPLRKYLGKRATGVANLIGPRRGAHPPRVAKALVEAVDAQQVDHVLVTGDLTIRGKTKRVSFPAKLGVGETEVSATTEFVIDRQDFDVAYPGRPDDLIQDNVLLQVDFVAPR